MRRHHRSQTVVSGLSSACHDASSRTSVRLREEALDVPDDGSVGTVHVWELGVQRGQLTTRSMSMSAQPPVQTTNCASSSPHRSTTPTDSGISTDWRLATMGCGQEDSSSRQVSGPTCAVRSHSGLICSRRSPSSPGQSCDPRRHPACGGRSSADECVARAPVVGSGQAMGEHWGT